MVSKVKICCISSVLEASLAIQYGAAAIGLVGQMPSGPGVISDELIRSIAAATPRHIDTFLLSSETRAEEVIRHHQGVKTTTIQLVDALENRAYHLIREALPGVRLVQVIHVLDDASVEEALEIAPMVDALLLDSGNPKLSVKELGGTGRTHNWALSRRIREQADVPIFLAGGLTPDNVLLAIEAVDPYGLDLCSGVRTAGQLDERKLAAFFKALG